MSMHAFQTSRCRHNLICAYQPIIIAFMSSTNVFFIWITPNKPSFTGRKILEGDLLNVKVNQASNIKLPAFFMYINVKPCDLFKEQVRFSLIIFVWMVWERDTAKIYVCAIHAKVRLGLSEPLSVQSVHSLHAGFPTQVSSTSTKGLLSGAPNVRKWNTGNVEHNNIFQFTASVRTNAFLAECQSFRLGQFQYLWYPNKMFNSREEDFQKHTDALYFMRDFGLSKKELNPWYFE